jgi:hypothetical protein
VLRYHRHLAQRRRPAPIVVLHLTVAEKETANDTYTRNDPADDAIVYVMPAGPAEDRIFADI